MELSPQIQDKLSQAKEGRYLLSENLFENSFESLTKFIENPHHDAMNHHIIKHNIDLVFLSKLRCDTEKKHCLIFINILQQPNQIDYYTQ